MHELKFEVGDRVQVVYNDPRGCHYSPIGEIITIKRVEPESRTGEEFEDYQEYYCSNGLWYSEEELGFAPAVVTLSLKPKPDGGVYLVAVDTAGDIIESGYILELTADGKLLVFGEVNENLPLKRGLFDSICIEIVP